MAINSSSSASIESRVTESSTWLWMAATTTRRAEKRRT